MWVSYSSRRPNRYFWYNLFSSKTVFGKNARVKEGAHADEIRLDDTVLSNYLFYFGGGREMTKFYKKSFLRHLKNSHISIKTLAKRRTHEFCFLCTTLDTQSSQSKEKCSQKNISLSMVRLIEPECFCLPYVKYSYNVLLFRCQRIPLFQLVSLLWEVIRYIYS